MKIKIESVQKKKSYSKKTKNKILVALGLATSLSLFGCLSTAGIPIQPEDEELSSSSVNEPTAGIIEAPASSYSAEVPLEKF